MCNPPRGAGVGVFFLVVDLLVIVRCVVEGTLRDP